MIVIDNENGTKVISYMPKNISVWEGKLVMKTGNHCFQQKIKNIHRSSGQRIVERMEELQKYYDGLRVAKVTKSIFLQISPKAIVNYVPISTRESLSCEPVLNRKMLGDQLWLTYVTFVGSDNEKSDDKTEVDTIFLQGKRLICDLKNSPNAVIQTFQDEEELDDWYHSNFPQNDIICDLSVGEIRIRK